MSLPYGGNVKFYCFFTKVMSPQNPTPVSSCPSRSSCWTQRCTTPTPRWRSPRTCSWSRTRASTPARTCPPTCSRPSSGQPPAFVKGLSHEQCWGSGMFIPDHAWFLSFPDPTTATKKEEEKINCPIFFFAISQRLKVLFTHKILIKLSKIWVYQSVTVTNRLFTRVSVTVIFFYWSGSDLFYTSTRLFCF